MLQVGGDLDFLEESLRAERRRELRLEHLERDLSVVSEVVSHIHGGHAALAELSLDAVAVGECSLQLFKVRRWLGHSIPLNREGQSVPHVAGEGQRSEVDDTHDTPCRSRQRRLIAIGTSAPTVGPDRMQTVHARRRPPTMRSPIPATSAIAPAIGEIGNVSRCVTVALIGPILTVLRRACR